MLIPNKLNITYTTIMPDGKRFLKSTESNAVSTEILTYSVLKEIRSDKTTVFAGKNVRNAVTLTNKSAAKLFLNFFKISQPNGANYVAGSVKINGTAQPDYNPITGFALPDINPDETVVIEYEIKAEKPTKTPATHFATFDYTVNDPARGNVNYSENTDILSLKVIDNAGQPIIRDYTKSYNDDIYGYGYGYGCRNCCNCCNYCDCRNFYNDFYC